MIDEYYLQAIKKKEKTYNVKYPIKMVESMSHTDFEAQFVSKGCEEHIMCASIHNMAWHYSGGDYKSLTIPLRVFIFCEPIHYKIFPMPSSAATSFDNNSIKISQFTSDTPLGDVKKGWLWCFASENQGVYNLYAFYETLDTDPLILSSEDIFDPLYKNHFIAYNALKIAPIKWGVFKLNKRNYLEESIC